MINLKSIIYLELIKKQAFMNRFKLKMRLLHIFLGSIVLSLLFASLTLLTKLFIVVSILTIFAIILLGVIIIWLNQSCKMGREENPQIFLTHSDKFLRDAAKYLITTRNYKDQNEIYN